MSETTCPHCGAPEHCRGAGSPALDIGFEGQFVRFEPSAYERI